MTLRARPVLLLAAAAQYCGGHGHGQQSGGNALGLAVVLAVQVHAKNPASCRGPRQVSVVPLGVRGGGRPAPSYSIGTIPEAGRHEEVQG